LLTGGLRLNCFRAVRGTAGCGMAEWNNDKGVPGAVESRSERDVDAASNSRARLIASAIALLSSAALVTWAAMHSHI
jgi:hypothetical protein